MHSLYDHRMVCALMQPLIHSVYYVWCGQVHSLKEYEDFAYELAAGPL